MKAVISASRRTDMPACYFETLTAALRCGRAEVPNPYSGRVRVVDLDPAVVHTLVLWSKDFRRVLANPAPFAPYRMYFLFTINDMPSLEPGIPSLADRLDQADELAAQYGPERIGWRYDPVVFTGTGPLAIHDSFSRIGERVRRAGMTRVIFSFLDLYGKVRVRNRRLGLGIVDPPDDVKRAYAAELAARARNLGLDLHACAEDATVAPGSMPGGCIDGVLLSRLAGEPADTAPDTGQRSACRCTKSRDIGSYRTMPCDHGCRYCYANPVIDVMPETAGRTA